MMSLDVHARERRENSAAIGGTTAVVGVEKGDLGERVLKQEKGLVGCCVDGTQRMSGVSLL